jgi:hypothetical protein
MMAPTNTKKATKLADPKATVIRISVAGLARKPRVRKGAVIRADGLEKDGVDALLVDAVKAKGGALHSALCRKLKWKKCSRRLARAAKIAGLKLKATRVASSDIRFEVAR